MCVCGGESLYAHKGPSTLQIWNKCAVLQTVIQDGFQFRDNFLIKIIYANSFKINQCSHKSNLGTISATRSWPLCKRTQGDVSGAIQISAEKRSHPCFKKRKKSNSAGVVLAALKTLSDLIFTDLRWIFWEFRVFRKPSYNCFAEEYSNTGYHQ